MRSINVSLCLEKPSTECKANIAQSVLLDLFTALWVEARFSARRINTKHPLGQIGNRVTRSAVALRRRCGTYYTDQCHNYRGQRLEFSTSLSYVFPTSSPPYKSLSTRICLPFCCCRLCHNHRQQLVTEGNAAIQPSSLRLATITSNIRRTRPPEARKQATHFSQRSLRVAEISIPRQTHSPEFM
jgi:hypothetical protein